MDLYGLTSKGLRIARNYRSPNTSEWKIIHYLYGTANNRATMGQIADNIGETPTQTSIIIRTKLNGIVAKE